VVQIADAAGNPVSQSGTTITASIASGGPALSGTTAVATDGAGQAVFTDLTITGAIGPRTLGFAGGGLTAATSTPITIAAGAATQIAVNSGNHQVATAGTAVTVPPAVIVHDVSGNPVESVSVMFAVTGGGGTITPPSPVLTNASGIATAASWVLGTTAGVNTATATGAGTLSGNPVTFTDTAKVGAAANLAKSGGDNLSGQVGTALGTPHEVLVTDANGNPVAGVTVTWAAASGGGSVAPTSSVTDVNGHATTTRTLGITPGTQTTTASATLAGGPATVTFSITATVSASTMTKNGGFDQIDTAGATLPTPLSVKVTDNFSNPVANVLITWTVTDGGGHVAPDTSRTDGSGIATTSWTLGTTTSVADSVQSVRATGIGTPVDFLGYARPGNISPAQTTVNAVPASITASSGGSATTVTVTARDGFGNAIPGKSVVLAASGSGNSLTQPAGPTNNAGATTGTLSATVAEPKVISATVGGVAITRTDTVAVTPAAATKLQFIVQPSDVAAGAAIAPPLQVEVRDQFGNRVTSSTAGITLAFANNAGSGALAGTKTQAASAGVASFNDLSVDKVAAGYTLAATSASVANGDTSTAFAVTPAAVSAAQSTVSAASPITAGSGSSTITVTAKDAFGNAVVGATVVLAASGSGNTLTQPSLATNGSGVATGSLTATVAESKTVSATIDGVGITQTATVVVQPDVATHLVFTAQPTNVTAGATIAPNVVVTARDALGNVATGFSGTVTVSIQNNPGGDTLSGTKARAAVNGIATFNDLSIAKAGTGYTLAAAAGGVTGDVSSAFTVGPAAASQLVFSVEPSTATAGVAIAPAVEVTAFDALGNVATGFSGNVTVAIQTNPGGGTLSGTTPQPASNGVATFNDLSINKSGAGYTLSATATSVTGATSASFNIRPAAATHLVITIQPRDTVAGDVINGSGGIRVAARDAFDNRDTAFTDSVRAVIVTNPGGATLSGTKALKDTAGVALFTTLSIDKVGTGYTLGFTASGLTGATSTPFAISAAAASQIAINAGDGQTATVGTAVATPPAALVTDAFGNPVAGIPVTFAVGSGGGVVDPTTPVATNASGIAAVNSWTLGTAPGANTLSATATGLTGSPLTFAATGATGAATTIALNGGNSQTDTIGATLAPYSVKVTDVHNNPVANVVVTWAKAGGGTITASSTTNGSGIATATRVLGDTAGTQTATATVGGLTGSPVNFTATATHGSATTIALNGGNAQTDTIGATLAPYTVVVTDRAANPVNGITVTWAAAGGGSITPSSATNASGVATATRVLGNTAGTQTATATVGGLSGSPVNFSATANHGNATTIAINAGDGQSAQVNTAVATAPAVIVHDRASNPVPGINVTFAVATGGGTVDPTTAVATDGSGIAAVNSWTLGSSAGSNTLTATASGLTGSPLTFSATATAGTATTIALNAGNAQTDTIGATLAVPYSVKVTDGSNNPVAGVTVTWAASGGGSITPSSTTDAGGIASATRVLGNTAGPQTATATVGGLSGSPVNFTATANHGNATTIAINAGDGQSAQVGTTVATPPSVIVHDRASNLVSGTSVTFAVATGGGTVDPTSAVLTNGSGIAAVISWTLGSTAGANTLTATAGGLTGSPLTFTATGTVGAVDATHSTVSASPTSIVASSGSTVSTITVTAKDQFGNPIAGATVVLAATGTGNTLTQPAGLTNGSGVATGTLSSTVAESKTVSATIDGVAITQTATVVVNTGGVSASLTTVTVNPTSIVATAGGTRSTITVTAKDTLGNAVSGATVVLSATGTGDSLIQPGLTASNGVATGSLSSTVAEAKTVSATVNGVAINQHPTITVTFGPRARLKFNVQPSNTAATAAITPAVLVAVTDSFGNPVSGGNQPTVFVRIANNPSSGTLSGTLSATATGTPRVATFSNLHIDKAGVGYTLTDSSNSALLLLRDTSAAFDITASAATTIALNGGNAQTDTIGATLATSYSVKVTDGSSNPVSGVTVTWTAAAGSITPSSVTDGSGIATAIRVLGNTAGTQTASATVGGLTGSPVSFSATATHGNATTIALNGGNTQTDTIGATLGTPYTVLVTDRAANPVNGITVTWAAVGGGSITPSSATNASGIASATRVLGTAIGAQTASATVSGLSGSPVGFTATATHGNATTIALNGGNTQTDTIGATLATPYTVLVSDRLANPVNGATVTWAAVGGGSITPSSISDASGIASATRVLGNTAGTQTATATVSGLTGSPVNFTATANHGNASTIAINAGDGQSAQVNTAVATAPAVIVSDRASNPVPGVGVTFAVASGGGTVDPTSAVLTNGSGIAAVNSWTLGASAGSNTLTATSGGLTGSPLTFTATATAGTAANIALVAGNNQTDTIGATLGTPYSVKVTDAGSNPVSGITVTWAAVGGSITPSSITDGSGFATATRVLGTAAGTQTATATVGGLTGSPVNFTATATHGNATSIAENGGDTQTDTIGATLAPYTVLVTDRAANPVSGITVTWAAAGGGSITPSSATNASGIASATRVLGNTAGTQTATATVGGLSGSPVGFTATANHGNATTIAINAGDGQSAPVNTAVATPPGVIVRDRASNPVPGVGVTFAVATGGGTVDPTSAVLTNGSGIAAVTSWTLGASAGSNTLTATSGGLTGSPLTFTATATAGAATTIALNGGNAQTDTIGATLGTLYSVKVTDGSSNPVSGVTVTWAAAGGSITPSSITDGSGIASATRVLGNTAGTQTATATVGGLAGSPVNFSATATHGNATTIAENGGDTQTDTIGATLGTPYTVLVTDRGANPVAGITVTWAAGGGGSITPSSITDGSGIASATRVLGNAAGTQTATATVSGLTGSPVNFSATATHGNATTIALNAGNSQTDTIQATLATPYSVLVTDRAGNPVPGVSVDWAASGGSFVTTPTTTNGSGIASATRVLGTALGAQTSTATVSGLTGSPVNFTATVTAGNAASLSFTTEPNSATAGVAISPAVVVTALDRLGNTATAFSGTVTMAIGTNAGGGTLSGTLTPSASAGVATFTDLSIDKAGSGYTLTATAVGVTGGTSSTFDITPGTVDASQSTVTATSPISILAGDSSTVTVTAKDQFGNLISGSTVVLSSSGLGDVITQPATPTDVNGVATGYLKGAVPGSRTVTAKIDGTTIVQTASVTVNP
jgi:adhesin/invasin